MGDNSTISSCHYDNPRVAHEIIELVKLIRPASVCIGFYKLTLGENFIYRHPAFFHVDLILARVNLSRHRYTLTALVAIVNTLCVLNQFETIRLWPIDLVKIHANGCSI